MSGVNPAQENKKGVGAKQTLSRSCSKLCSYFKKKKIQPLILFILSLIKHFLSISKNCLASPMSLYIKLHEGLSALFNITTQTPSTVPDIEPSGELNDSYDDYPDYFSSPSPYLAKS